jgi:cysteine desulfurase
MIEHDSILRQAPESERFNLPVGGGLVEPETLAVWLRIAGGGLLAIQHCNSETGVLQPIGAIGEAVDAAGSYILADCSQSACKLPLPPADLVIVSAHKFGGPPGIGALLARDLGLLVPQGGQERGYRGGTENLPAVLGMAAAVEAWASDSGALQRQVRNRAILDEALASNGATVICAGSLRSPFIGSYHMPGMSAMAQLVRFDAMGFSVSAGSACSSGSTKPSHVLQALGLEPAIAANVIRVSFGKGTVEDDVMAFAAAWAELAREARSRAA